jgi:hypothetical protein
LPAPFEPSYRPEPEGVVSIGDAKVTAFIVSFQIFSGIFRRFLSSASIRIISKNCPFFEVGCKGTSLCEFNQIFLSTFSFLTLRLNYPVSKNFPAFEADGKDTTSILTIKVFLNSHQSFSTKNFPFFHFITVLYF